MRWHWNIFKNTGKLLGYPQECQIGMACRKTECSAFLGIFGSRRFMFCSFKLEKEPRSVLTVSSVLFLPTLIFPGGFKNSKPLTLTAHLEKNPSDDSFSQTPESSHLFRSGRSCQIHHYGGSHMDIGVAILK